ncbi:unnamed protein product [Symbiodinium sp. CCMP2456]|nr:unnamed protein product [Symbiodinium sp. CCMP2456]
MAAVTLRCDCNLPGRTFGDGRRRAYFGRGGPPTRERVRVDIEPLLFRSDFERAGVELERPPRPDFAAEWRAFLTVCRWILKALLGTVSAATLVLQFEYFILRAALAWLRSCHKHARLHYVRVLGNFADDAGGTFLWQTDRTTLAAGDNFPTQHGAGYEHFVPRPGSCESILDFARTVYGGPQRTLLGLSDPARHHFARRSCIVGTFHAVSDFTAAYFSWCDDQRTADELLYTVRHDDVAGTLDGCLNLSLSPRSAYLFYTFQLSIMQQKGVLYHFAADAEICTLGFRPTQQWRALYFGSGRARMWNRRYVDFLIRTATLEVLMDPSWQTFLLIRHFQLPYQLVSDLNRYFADPQCRHFRLMHLPVLPLVYELSYDQPEGWVPLSGATPSTLTRPARL